MNFRKENYGRGKEKFEKKNLLSDAFRADDEFYERVYTSET